MTVRSFPENRTRLPFELGWSPSPASMMPAFTSSSLYFPISVRSCSLGISPASDSLLALTITRTRIVVPPLHLGVGAASLRSLSAARHLPLLGRRTSLPYFDTAHDEFFRRFFAVRTGPGPIAPRACY